MAGVEVSVYPVTADRWPDLERLFGKNGACGGCWCMWWKQSSKEYAQLRGEQNKLLLKQSVEAGDGPGLLAYVAGEPAGWCAVAPRAAYSRLEKTRALKAVDDKPVWTVVCFFVAKRFRRQRVTHALIAAALDYAGAHGAKIVEAYPVEPKDGKTPDVYAYPGVASTFCSLGFVEVARRSETRPIMRYVLSEE
jgi:GNAT superfamily N-acetyltransferase